MSDLYNHTMGMWLFGRMRFMELQHIHNLSPGAESKAINSKHQYFSVTISTSLVATVVRVFSCLLLTTTLKLSINVSLEQGGGS